MKTIWIIDEQDSYREGFKKLLEISIPKCRIKTFRSITNEDVHILQKLPDLILIAPPYQNSNTLLIIDFFISQNKKVVMLSMELNKSNLLKILSRNIQGYLVKNMDTKELVLSIKNILNGEKYIHPLIGKVLLDEYHSIRSINSQENSIA